MLYNRNLHISGQLECKKVDIDYEKVDIQTLKVDIDHAFAEKWKGFSNKTITHICKMMEQFGTDIIFSRSVIAKLLQAEIIKPVSGYGKGKYKFEENNYEIYENARLWK